MQNRQELVLLISFPILGDCVNELLQKYVPKIVESRHFEFNHFATAPPRYAAETFNAGAQLHSFQYETVSKVGVKD